MKNIFAKNNKGYTLLFAVLVTSLVVSVAVSILNITRKESILAGVARESQAAIYAADAGIECAVYQQSQENKPFQTPVWVDKFTNATVPSNESSPSFSCANMTLTAVGTGSLFTLPNNISAPVREYVFNLNLSNGNETSCANVRVSMGYGYDSTSGPYEQMTVESRGYNAGWNASAGDCSGASPKKAERAIRLRL